MAVVGSDHTPGETVTDWTAMTDTSPTRVEVDGELFDVVARADCYDIRWVSGPNPGYGFTSSRSPGRPLTESELRRSIRQFLAQVDEQTGYIE